MITTLRGVQDLLMIAHCTVMSDEDKAQVRTAYRKGVSPVAKVQYNDYFLSLDREEQEKIQAFWGFDKW